MACGSSAQTAQIMEWLQEQAEWESSSESPGMGCVHSKHSAQAPKSVNEREEGINSLSSWWFILIEDEGDGRLMFAIQMTPVHNTEFLFLCSFFSYVMKCSLRKCNMMLLMSSTHNRHQTPPSSPPTTHTGTIRTVQQTRGLCKDALTRQYISSSIHHALVPEKLKEVISVHK